MKFMDLQTDMGHLRRDRPIQAHLRTYFGSPRLGFLRSPYPANCTDLILWRPCYSLAQSPLV
jgi:hypothetical protein